MMAEGMFSGSDISARDEVLTRRRPSKGQRRGVSSIHNRRAGIVLAGVVCVGSMNSMLATFQGGSGPVVRLHLHERCGNGNEAPLSEIADKQWRAAMDLLHAKGVNVDELVERAGERLSEWRESPYTGLYPIDYPNDDGAV